MRERERREKLRQRLTQPDRDRQTDIGREGGGLTSVIPVGYCCLDSLPSGPQHEKVAYAVVFLYAALAQPVFAQYTHVLFANPCMFVLAGGRFPAGVDARYPRKSVYPGVLDFYRELDLGANGPSEWPHGQVRDSGGVRWGGVAVRRRRFRFCWKACCRRASRFGQKCRACWMCVAGFSFLRALGYESVGCVQPRVEVGLYLLFACFHQMLLGLVWA